ncbi:MAG: hypothetical protein IPK53_07800 [bacterium]|nr:hypothetical protein [bacterium]
MMERQNCCLREHSLDGILEPSQIVNGRNEYATRLQVGDDAQPEIGAPLLSLIQCPTHHD